MPEGQRPSPLLYRRGDQGSRLSRLPDVTQAARGKPWIPNRIFTSLQPGLFITLDAVLEEPGEVA